MLLASLLTAAYVLCLLLNWGWFYPFTTKGFDDLYDSAFVEEGGRAAAYRTMAGQTFALSAVFSVVLPLSILIVAGLTEFGKHGWTLPFTSSDPARKAKL